MKGHTKIELTNMKTGEVQTIEEHNIVTNWLNDIHQTQFPLFGDSFKYTFDRYAGTTYYRSPYEDFGGLIIFSEQLEADPNNYYPKGKATMVGHASNDMYSGKDLTRGSFNTNLSSYSYADRRATFVWDFNMEQSNGTIGTICLCNHDDGKIGYGSKYYVEDSNLGKSPFYHHAGTANLSMTCYIRYYYPAIAGNSVGSYGDFVPVFVSKSESKIVYLLTSSVNGNLVFAIDDIDASTVAPFDYIYRTDADVSNSGYRTGRTQFVEIPISMHYHTYSGRTTTFLNMSGLMILSGLDYQGNFWFAQDVHEHHTSSVADTSMMFYWAPGTATKFTKVNLKTMETTEYTVYNTTGQPISVNQGYASYVHGFLSSLCVVNDYLYVKGDDAKLYAINLQNNSDVHVITLDDGTDKPVTLYMGTYEGDGTAYNASSVHNRRGWLVDVLGDKIIFNRKGGLTYDDETVANSDYMYILDTATFTCKPLCSDAHPLVGLRSARNYGDYSVYCCTDGIARLCLRPYRYYSSGSYYGDIETTRTSDSNGTFIQSNVKFPGIYSYPPLGLITINTLSEPVVKTADMTMRITYTITA